MLKTELYSFSEQLANFVLQNEFEPITQRTPYYHMGATISDSILQAGLNYRNVVYPRVLNLMTKFTDYKTTCDFIILMQFIPLSELINWKNKEKLKRISNLSWFLYNNGIENEDQLAIWLETDKNVSLLRELNGIGPKSVDYLKMLSGHQEIAVDRHLFSFLEMAGIFIRTYQDAKQIYIIASKLLGISKFELDRKVWTFMSKV